MFVSEGVLMILGYCDRFNSLSVVPVVVSVTGTNKIMFPQLCVITGVTGNIENKSGERGIRTPGTPEGYTDFRDRPIRPLWHLSENSETPLGKGLRARV